MFVWDNAGEVYLRSQGAEPKPSMREDVRSLSLHQSASYFQTEYGLPHTAEEIMAGINTVVEHFYIHEVQPKPGVVDFLARLKKLGIPLCIATASEHYQIEAALRRCGMAQFFDAIFTCTDVGHGKDEPVIFRKAMEHFGADRCNTVVFEDALHAVQTAKSDDFRVAAVFDESEQRQEEIRDLADWYISDFRRIRYEDENSIIHCGQ